ncbi:MAG: GntR family transcriptional regulator, partial [Erysipelotrichia bacterium]|nr:GntR family transcriptional regulator [Erysipelotrichia bacterium]
MRLLTQDILICNEIKYMIENKPILEGEKLPSERELAALLDVQRPTVRTGLKLLLQEGWIYAKERSGYFVSPKRITKNVSQLSSTTKMMLSLGKEMSLRVIKVEKQEVDKELSTKIKLPIGTKIFYIVRIRMLNEEKISIDLSYIPASIAPK